MPRAEVAEGVEEDGKRGMATEGPRALDSGVCLQIQEHLLPRGIGHVVC